MNRFQNILNWLIYLCVPLLLIMTAIRATMTPLFPIIEYRMPGFPDDPYGLTLEERLTWSPYAINYLLNSADISYLGDLFFEDGSPLFNSRELSHMVDVKNLVQAMMVGWYILLVLVIISFILHIKTGRLILFKKALAVSGWFTVGLMFTILAIVAINFNGLFTQFHHLFFTGDTWLFYYSDTLIRLFPMRFWQDAFILVGLLTLAGATGLILLKIGEKKQL